MTMKPIYIYLDMNKWIPLAQAKYDEPAGVAYKDILECAQTAVQSGKVVFPFADVHILEARKNNDINRQRRLLTFIWELSGGVALAPSVIQVKQQIESRVAEFYNLPKKSEQSVFGRGPVFAYGEVERLRARVGDDENALADYQEYFTTLDGLEQILSVHVRSGGLQSDQSFQQRIAIAAKEHKTNRIIDKRLRKIKYIQRNFQNHPRVLTTLNEFGIDVNLFNNLPPDDLLEFFTGIPFFNIEMELLTESEQDTIRYTQPNDIVDVTFFGAVIPVCDIVVSERHWVSVARRKRIDRKYSTELFTNLHDLKPYLC